MKYLTITAILCLILAGASFAGNVTMTEVITGGNLTLTMPSNFSFAAKTLGGYSTQQAIGTSGYFEVEDSRGTGDGWNLTFKINQFQTSGTPAKTIPAENYYMSLGFSNISTQYGQSKDVNNGPLGLLGSLINIQNVDVESVHALPGYGMGHYMIQPSFRLNIPAETYAGTYTATLTATLNNVP